MAAGDDARRHLQSRAAIIVAAGLAAVEAGSVKEMVLHDVEVHRLIYDGSGNPLIARAAEPHWRQLRRVMGEVLRRAEAPHVIWHQHQEILDAILAGDAATAQARAVSHVERAASRLAEALDAETAAFRR
jgi:DNA-binding GntR family transcriptional regulator